MKQKTKKQNLDKLLDILFNNGESDKDYLKMVTDLNELKGNITKTIKK